jgi:C-terminal processing protease CtpA/Prc
MNAYTRSIEPHSAYMSPRSVDNFEISMRLSLDGIGAMLQRETEYTSVIEVVPGGPADLDGRLQRATASSAWPRATRKWSKSSAGASMTWLP